MAASVGPYRLCSSHQGSRVVKSTAPASGSSSPEQITRRSAVAASTPSSARKTVSIDGTKWAVVTRSSTSRSRR